MRPDGVNGVFHLDAGPSSAIAIFPRSALLAGATAMPSPGNDDDFCAFFMMKAASSAEPSLTGRTSPRSAGARGRRLAAQSRRDHRYEGVGGSSHANIM